MKAMKAFITSIVALFALIAAMYAGALALSAAPAPESICSLPSDIGSAAFVVDDDARYLSNYPASSVANAHATPNGNGITLASVLPPSNVMDAQASPDHWSSADIANFPSVSRASVAAIDFCGEGCESIGSAAMLDAQSIRAMSEEVLVTDCALT